MKKSLLCCAVPVLLTACSELPAVSPEKTASITLKPAFEENGYRTQAVVAKYVKANINHLVLTLFTANGGIEGAAIVSKDVLNANLDSVQTITNLKANTTYRVHCYAYKAPGTDGANLISTSDANSYTDVTLTNDDAPVLSVLKVRLVDVPFAGQATNSINVTNGDYVTVATESIL